MGSWSRVDLKGLIWKSKTQETEGIQRQTPRRGAILISVNEPGRK
jgi:hypothetical protein